MVVEQSKIEPLAKSLAPLILVDEYEFRFYR